MKYLKKYQKTIIICFLLILSIIIICIGSSYSLYKIETKGQVHNTIVTGIAEIKCEYEDGYVWNFNYNGKEQEFNIPCSGTYKLETWGAQGGSIEGIGGYGGFSTGIISASKSEKLYINVGGQGNNTTGGYNGGGSGGTSCKTGADYRDGAGGGGATHIATQTGLLASLSEAMENIYIVSAGGGGATFIAYTLDGGAGGGYKGNDGPGTDYIIPAGNQTEGYLFGQGQDGGICTNADWSWGESGRGGGGGGFYGGNASQYLNNGVAAGAGGSSYIGNSKLTEKTMYCYNCTESNEESIKTISTTCHNSNPTINCTKEGNGYVKITLIQSNSELLPPQITESGEYQNEVTISVITPGQAKNGINYYEYFITQENISPTTNTTPTGVTNNEVNINQTGVNYVYYRTVSNSNMKSLWSKPSQITIFKCLYSTGDSWNFDYTGDEQTFEIPCYGTYKLETWGAQGGSAFGTGGYGGYATGNISTNQRITLYINVGGQGTIRAGGYNGGGTGGSTCKVHDNYSDAGGGGGATHIATHNGLLTSLSSSIEDIYIVSAGGGGGAKITDGLNGGSAGGYKGNEGIGATYNMNGATQTEGYSFGQGQAGGTCTTASGSWGESGRGGAGGGFYGGYASQYTTNGVAAGGGGSSYIGNSLLTNKAMYCYECEESNEESTKTISTTCTSSIPTENCAKQGNGYAKITYLGN